MGADDNAVIADGVCVGVGAEAGVGISVDDCVSARVDDSVVFGAVNDDGMIRLFSLALQ